MSNAPVMTAKEKRCLSLASTFANEASKQLGLHRLFVAQEGMDIGVAMLGEIAADKYRDCMRQPQQRTAPAPKQ